MAIFGVVNSTAQPIGNTTLAAPKNTAERRQSDIPTNPTERKAWVIYQLKIRGLSLASIARDEGVVQQAVASALLVPSSHLEAAIARAVEVPVIALFPERYTADGRRLNPQRSRNRNSEPTARNVEKRGAA